MKKFRSCAAFIFLILCFSITGCKKQEKISVLTKYSPDNVSSIRAVNYNVNPGYQTEKTSSDKDTIKKIISSINDSYAKPGLPNSISAFNVSYFVTMNDKTTHSYILTYDKENKHRIIYNRDSYTLSEGNYEKLTALYDEISSEETTSEIKNIFG